MQRTSILLCVKLTGGYFSTMFSWEGSPLQMYFSPFSVLDRVVNRYTPVLNSYVLCVCFKYSYDQWYGFEIDGMLCTPNILKSPFIKQVAIVQMAHKLFNTGTVFQNKTPLIYQFMVGHYQTLAWLEITLSFLFFWEYY